MPRWSPGFDTCKIWVPQLGALPPNLDHGFLFWVLAVLGGYSLLSFQGASLSALGGHEVLQTKVSPNL